MARFKNFASRVAPRRSAGFTLIELMITVAVIGILAKIALPAYLDYVKRGKLQEAFQSLTSYSLQLGQYYQDNRTYATACTATVLPPPTSPNFTYTCALNTATNYTIVATGSTSVTSGFVFTLSDSGVRQTTGAPSGWATSTSCWVNSRSGSCA